MEKYKIVAECYYLPEMNSHSISHQYLDYYFQPNPSILTISNEDIKQTQIFRPFPAIEKMLPIVRELANEKNVLLGFEDDTLPDAK
jgi:hypothetical protein